LSSLRYWGFYNDYNVEEEYHMPGWYPMDWRLINISNKLISNNCLTCIMLDNKFYKIYCSDYLDQKFNIDLDWYCFIRLKNQAESLCCSRLMYSKVTGGYNKSIEEREYTDYFLNSWEMLYSIMGFVDSMRLGMVFTDRDCCGYNIRYYYGIFYLSVFFFNRLYVEWYSYFSSFDYNLDIRKVFTNKVKIIKMLKDPVADDCYSLNNFYFKSNSGLLRKVFNDNMLFKIIKSSHSEFSVCSWNIKMIRLWRDLNDIVSIGLVKYDNKYPLDLMGHYRGYVNGEYYAYIENNIDIVGNEIDSYWLSDELRMEIMKEIEPFFKDLNVGEKENWSKLLKNDAVFDYYLDGYYGYYVDYSDLHMLNVSWNRIIKGWLQKQDK